MDVIGLVSALGFVVPDTLKGTFRRFRIFSERPLTWLSPIISTLFLEHDVDTGIVVDLCFILYVVMMFALYSFLNLCLIFDRLLSLGCGSLLLS